MILLLPFAAVFLFLAGFMAHRLYGGIRSGYFENGFRGNILRGELPALFWMHVGLCTVMMPVCLALSAGCAFAYFATSSK